MSLPLTDAAGRIYILPGGSPVKWNEGFGYSATGQLCVTTTLTPNDTYEGGIRRSSTGALVVAAQGGTLSYNGGWPCNLGGASDGAVARQVDTTPAATDPFVAGVRIGAAGGVYMTTAAVP